METKEDNLYIYLVSCIQGYVFADDKLKTGSGSCSPVRLILKKDDLKFVEYKEPVDVMDLNDSLKELFPQKYYKMASNYTNSQDSLVAENKNKVIDWLKQLGKSKDSLI